MTTLRDLISARLDVEGIEDVPDEVIGDTLESIDGTLADKIDAIAGLLNTWKRHEAGIAEEIRRLQDRKATFGNRTRRLKEYLLFQLRRLNNPKLETDLHTVSIRKGVESVCVDDQDLLPPDFIKIERSVRKAELKAALKEGPVDGAHLERGPEYVVVK